MTQNASDAIALRQAVHAVLVHDVKRPAYLVLTKVYNPSLHILVFFLSYCVASGSAKGPAIMAIIGYIIIVHHVHDGHDLKPEGMEGHD